ncbi:3-carboxy-cis,cis-muconate cycloisomerase [Ruegeria sp. EL01]|jgi:3-carboxy-cis,cis-muconate cycloisomerase|uniref:3-carboxy-cis,cis-muconate cycloisomerase n=1 Tax=Ruegeria sp. EL01 TaxID=2107578 RepID=UPI000EA80B29|nr:3-carboxy-cis,cis-muconate cycloisomerase [Ruegeria sp. EL01]
MSDVFEHPWLSGLFGDCDADAIWSAQQSLAHMLTFEAAYSSGLGAIGIVSLRDAQLAAQRIEATNPDLEILRSGTVQDGLPVPALVRYLKLEAGQFKNAIHTGATSQDVMDTALALTLRANSDLLADRLSELVDLLGQVTKRFGSNMIMGRTRMQAALPVTVGHRLETWCAPLAEHLRRLEQLRPRAECVQLGGAVGDGQAIGIKYRELAEFLASALELHLPNRSWHATREGITEYASFLSLISGSLGKMGQDICLMAQQGVDEIKLSGGGGSSAMPHKKNPVLAELLVTLARFNATRVSGMHQALVHEQERSGSAWSLEWMILPSMAKATARSLSAAITLCTQIESIGEERK